MFEFMVGYVFGRATRGGPRISAKSVGMFLLFLMALAGIGWFVFSVTYTDHSVVECGGTALQDFYCRVMVSAKKIGLLLIGAVTLLAVLWTLIAKLRKG